MRRVLFLVLVAALGCAGARPRHAAALDEDDPAVEVTTVADYYDVRGQTANELRRALGEDGPEEHGRRFDARTTWRVEWKYQWDASPHACAIRQVALKLAVHYLLPRADPPAPLLPRWQQHLAALGLHEDGHAANGHAAAAGVLRALRALPAQASCAVLDEAANEAARAVVRHFNEEDLAYDEETGHGKTEGAVFP